MSATNDEQRGEELATHQTSPVRADDEVDQLDADERRDEAADAVDQQVAAQHRGGAEAGRNRTPRSASGISATMMSALKMTAERIADLRAVEVHDVEACRAPGTRRRTSPG